MVTNFGAAVNRSPLKASGHGLAYREDIDRLRGLAVAAVVAFHFEAPGVYGGYVGVDIFFVISGFLITQILQREIAARTFTFASFYERRVRRLLPALYTMVALTCIPASYLLLSSERVAFQKSIAATVTFSSNILFWLQSGYFDRTAVEKPLLHTWSLAVEEQFYLFFPLFIWGVLRSVPRLLLPVLAALGALSFVAGLVFINRGDVATAFYLSPFRAWEFLLGGVVACRGFPVIQHKIARTAVLGLAYVLLLTPIFGLRATSIFPGWNAVPPCLGAALFIWCGTGAPTVNRHRYSPFQIGIFFGKISYSLYLWHWPVFVFARFSKDGLTLTGADKLMFFALAVALATMSWRFVEQPVRSRTFLPTRGRAFAAAASASLGLLIIAATGLITMPAMTETERRISLMDSYNSFSEAAYRAGQCFRQSDFPLAESCLAISSTKPNVMIWGDSHVAHYYPGLARLAEQRGFNLLQATQSGCVATFKPPATASPFCRNFSEMVAPWFDSHKPDVVILSGDWMHDVHTPRFGPMIENIRATAASLSANGIRVFVIGPAVQFKTGLPSLIIRAWSKGLNTLPVSEMLRPDIFSGDAKMRAALPDHEGFTYLSVIDALCPGKSCPALIDEAPLTWDYGHLTNEGSIYAVERLFGKSLQAGQM